ncbi:hypothetical protein M2337_002418 [Sphingobium sp. B2D3A]|nr:MULTISPECIES: benenodin family lasso peptide [unclassified Sphingobium]MCW2338185.1 hypothetical protein [Sphingobium sp. B2D3A]MCW2384644.1 hypothetical protein [Sphingobium sp. B2D3D]
MQYRDDHQNDELIELGVASEATKGAQAVIFDNQNGRDLTGPGIADD